MSRFTFWQKVNPWFWLQNADDPTPPADYAVGDEEWLRALKWWFRNPFHNLFFYVIGICDQQTERRGVDPSHVFVWGWNFVITHAIGTPIYLPFVSYLTPKFRCYAGWRPGGALGFKLNFSSKGEFSPP